MWTNRRQNLKLPLFIQRVELFYLSLCIKDTNNKFTNAIFYIYFLSDPALKIKIIYSIELTYFSIIIQNPIFYCLSICWTVALDISESNHCFLFLIAILYKHDNQQRISSKFERAHSLHCFYNIFLCTH